MTRFVYVLPAGRFRWEVRVDDPAETGREWDEAQAGWRCPKCGDLSFQTWSPHEHPNVSLFYRRKAHALIAARAIAILIGGEVQPHDRRGRIQDPDSFGGDSPRRRG